MPNCSAGTLRCVQQTELSGPRDLRLRAGKKSSEYQTPADQPASRVKTIRTKSTW